MKILRFLFFSALLSGTIYSQTNYFYTGKNYGSEATFNPISVIINGGFDIFQVQRNRDLSTVPFSAGLNNLIRNIKDPITPITHYGWWNF